MQEVALFIISKIFKRKGDAHMNEEFIAKNKEEFIRIMHSLSRKGVDRLLEWLEKTDFYTAPASTKYHCAYKGGLVQHSLNVYRRLMDRICNEDKNRRPEEQLTAAQLAKLAESATICALCHDLCKVNFYVESTRNVKNKETGKWEEVATYTIVDPLPYGHGEKSVWMLEKFIRLSQEEAFAIRFHDGDFTGNRNTSRAFNLFPLAVKLHIADLEATYLDERYDHFADDM